MQLSEDLVKPIGIEDIEKHAGNANDMIKAARQTGFGFFGRPSDGIKVVRKLINGVGPIDEAYQKEGKDKDQHVGHGHGRCHEVGPYEI